MIELAKCLQFHLISEQVCVVVNVGVFVRLRYGTVCPLPSPSSPSLPASFQEMVLDALLAGKAVAITAVYYLMQGRLARYKRLTAKVPHATVSRMKKSRSYAGPTTTEAELVAAHVDPGRAPVQRVSHQLDQPRFVEWGCC